MQSTHMNNNERRSPKMQIIWNVLEAAKDNNDAMVIAVCRRLLWANILGWKKHARCDDIKLVLEFAE